MRGEFWAFGVLVIFFGISTPIYWYMSHEPAGTVALGLTFGLNAMIAAYLALTSRKIDRRPEDRKEAEVVEGAGDVGFFPPYSIWPLACALTLVCIALAPVFGWWLAIIGVGLGLLSLNGLVYQFYRGDHAH